MASTLVPIEQHQSATGTIPQGGAQLPAIMTGQSGASGTGEETSLPQEQSAIVGLVPLGEDQQILKQHELALQRLEQLQGDMVGGEKGGI